MNQRNSISIFVLIVLLAIVGMIGYFIFTNKSSQNIPIKTQTDETETSIAYTNTKYGFDFVLPISWKGYSIVTQEWEGNLINGQVAERVKGPEILIRHPLWSTLNNRQDIPIMIFTKEQWNQVIQESLSLGAAPIPPSELGRNTNYIFAIPARYNFAFLVGFEEVQQIIENKPLKSI